MLRRIKPILFSKSRAKFSWKLALWVILPLVLTKEAMRLYWVVLEETRIIGSKAKEKDGGLIGNSCSKSF